MTEYLNIVLAYATSMAPRDWALTAAILFVTVICTRLIRLLRQKPTPKRARKTAVDRGVVAQPAADVPPEPVRPIQVAPRPAPQRPAPHRQAPRPRVVAAAAPNAPAPSATPSNVAQALAKVSFSAKPLMPWEHYCLLRDIEAFLADQSAGHRLFSKVQLSDAFGVDLNKSSSELGDAVERALEPFRVDFLILDRQGMPCLALQMTPPSPVLETVFDKAGVPLLVLPGDYSWPTVELQLSRHLGAPLQPLRHAG